MRPDQLGAVVRQQRLQPGSFATILDRRGVVIWRSAAADRFIGKPAPQDVRAAIAGSKEGILESVSLEGVPAVGAYSRSPLSGWTFIVGVPQEVAQAGSTRTLLLALGGAIGLLLIGALIGLMAARRIARAVNNLAEFAVQIERGAAANYEPTGLNELDAAGEALANALQARKASEDRYKRIFDQASDLILTADLNQVITDCNPSAAAAVGIAREEAIGRQISDFVSPDDFERTSRALQEKLGAGGTTRYDVRVRSSSGEWLSWEINSGLTYDRHGSPVELHVVGRDITDRKRAEERQRLLINELNHRVKNTLAVVQSISTRHSAEQARIDPLPKPSKGA
jgi:PAS domain S-box-containing protein